MRNAQSSSCLYQRSDLTTTVAMSMFLQFLGQAIETIEDRFYTATQAARKRRARLT